MASWNPWHGCNKISAGCDNCYVYRSDAKYDKDSSIVTKNKSFGDPIRKKRNGEFYFDAGELVYTCFTSDFFLEDADVWRDEAWAMIKQRSDLNFLFITKRIHRFYDCIPSDWDIGYKNVTICCTVENQKMADFRLPIFLQAPIIHKNIVCEPLLEPINLENYLSDEIQSLLVGGESGTNARVCDYSWILDIRDQCINCDVPFIFRQTGAKFKKGERIYNVPRQAQHSQAIKAQIDTTVRSKFS